MRRDFHEDDELVSNAKADRGEFKVLYDKYYQKVYTYLWYRNGRDHESGEDLAQETFLNAIKSLDGYQSRGFSYLSYLLRIARNLLINQGRARAAVPLDEESLALLPDPDDTLERIERDDDVAGVWKAVLSLSLRDKGVLLMRYKKGLSIAEIAQVDGHSEEATRVALCRARSHLAHALGTFTDHSNHVLLA